MTRGPGGSTTVVVQQNTTIRTTVYTSPLADQSKLQQYLPILLDKFSTRKDTEIPAHINVNTAPQAVLSALPGLDDTDVQNIVTNQPPAGTGSRRSELSNAGMAADTSQTDAGEIAGDRAVHHGTAASVSSAIARLF